MAFEWTEEARARLQERLAEREPGETPEAERRRAELAARIEGVLAASAKGALTAADVEDAFGVLLHGCKPRRPRRAGGPPRWLTFHALAWCILGPALALAVELSTGMCAANFFDPLPTVAHAVLVGLVPLAGLLALHTLLSTPSNARVRATLVALGLVLPVTLLYCLAFLPLLPLTVFALFMGIGVLPLVPVLCFPSFLWLRSRLAALARERGLAIRRPFWSACAASTLALVLLEAPTLATRYWVDRVCDGTPTERAAALAHLQTFGHERTLRRLASGDQGSSLGATWILGRHFRATTLADGRRLWFLLHGEPFRGPVQPHDGPHGFEERDWTPFDPDQGTSIVGPVLAELTLTSSRLDAAVDGTAGVAYVEWILELANGHEFRNVEARMLVELPDEAVVSRATLWIGDEEREAAYAKSGDVRAAYETTALQQWRDPLLVTSAGDDHVLAQVFPIPSHGRCKWKLGLTVPLELGQDLATLRWPRLVERNFEPAHGLRHELWIEAPEELRSDELAVTRAANGWQGRATLAAASPLPPLRISRESVPAVACAFDETQDLVCAFELPTRDERPPAVLVLDGSAPLAPCVDALEPELARHAAPLFVAQPEGHVVREFPRENGWLTELAFAGGVDPLPALAAAWDRAQTLGTDVLWLAGPHPVLLSSTAALEQRLERTRGGPRLTCVPLVPGANRVLAEFVRDPRVACRPVQELALALAEPDAARFTRSWSFVPRGTSGARAGPRHLTALWASTQIEELLGSWPRRESEALRLAASQHLVTRISGAVVLESERDFEANGLLAAELRELPSVPEPETVLLLVVVVAAVAWAWLGRARVA